MGGRWKLLGVTLCVGAAVVGARADPGNGATLSRVNALTCADAGGVATIPAGTEVEVGLGNILKSRGLTTDFLRMERTTIVVDGGSPVDISALWSSPLPSPFPEFPGAWFTRIFYDTGVVLDQGQSMTFEFVLTEPHLYLDDLTFANGVSGRPVLFRPNTYVDDCTVTGR